MSIMSTTSSDDNDSDLRSYLDDDNDLNLQAVLAASVEDNSW